MLLYAKRIAIPRASKIRKWNVSASREDTIYSEIHSIFKQHRIAKISGSDGILLQAYSQIQRYNDILAEYTLRKFTV